jgi:hypothetical protein
MKPVSRHSVSKSGSASKFKRDVGRTNGHNMRMSPMRGGWRL